jgi:lipopolysaccharide transport system permease protein
MSKAPTSSDEPITWIRSAAEFRSLGFLELWRYRELIQFIVWRDVKVRYKQTVLGVAWAVLQPLASMVVFALIFGRLAHMPSDGIPYPIFALAALVPWTLFAQGLTQASGSVVASEDLIRKVYFPRLVIPVAAVGSSVVDFTFGLAVLVAMMPFYGMFPSFQVVWVPALVLLALAAAIATGLWMAALSTRYRDVRHMLPFLTQLWFFATPVAYPSSLVPEAWRPLYGINPMVGVIDGFRWALLGADTRPGPTIAVSVVAVLVLLLGGAAYFRHTERVIADVI